MTGVNGQYAYRLLKLVFVIYNRKAMLINFIAYTKRNMQLFYYY